MARPQDIFLPLAIPIAAVVTFTAVPAAFRIPAFLAMIGVVAGVALASRKQKKQNR
jgi:hypothetical protein